MRENLGKSHFTHGFRYSSAASTMREFAGKGGSASIVVNLADSLG